MKLWKRLFGACGRTEHRLPFDEICRDSMGLADEFRVKPLVSPTTVEMMGRARRKVDQSLEAEMAREVERLCGNSEIDAALAKSAATARLALLKAELGIGSPEQQDLCEKGPAPAQGGCD